jgi:CRISPR/Cas system-associated exonuclease Cas4 (RecB family)
MTKANDFVTRQLQARTLAHIAHWATESYSEHMALGAFYEALSELVDGFVEQYQGYYGKRMEPKAAAASADAIDDYLEAQVEWVERYRYEICDKDETSLQNTIDEVVRLYQTTLYKLRMLQ